MPKTAAASRSASKRKTRLPVVSITFGLVLLVTGVFLPQIIAVPTTSEIPLHAEVTSCSDYDVLFQLFTDHGSVGIVSGITGISRNLDTICLPQNTAWSISASNPSGYVFSSWEPAGNATVDSTVANPTILRVAYCGVNCGQWTTGKRASLTAHYTAPYMLAMLTNSGGTTVTQRSSGTTTITATLVKGSASTLTLACYSGLPAGASCSFTPSTGTPPFSSTVRIHTPSSAPVGSYTVTVRGSWSGGGYATDTSFTLTVKSQAVGLDAFGVKH